MRPTVRDLARTAGVSLATVDRVLNGRPGVRDGTVRRVHEAIDKIGFVRNASAATLARGRPLRFVFLLPAPADLFTRSLMGRIAEANLVLSAEMIELIVVEIPRDDPHTIAAAIASVSAEAADGIAIMAPESPQARDAISRRRQEGLAVIALVSGYQDGDAEAFVGIDDRAAGRTAARLMGRFAGGGPGTVIVVGETMQLRNELERRVGFDEVLRADFPALRVAPSLETYGDPARAARILAHVMQDGPVVGAYIPSTEAAVAVGALTGRVSDGCVRIAHERTLYTEAALRDGRLDVVIAQDPGHLVRSAIRRLRAAREGRPAITSQETIRIEVLVKDNL